MDENQLQQGIQQFLSRGNSQGGAGDYQDFLNQYMNAVNQGADPNQLMLMGAAIPADRRQEMLANGGLNLQMDSNPMLRQARQGVMGLLDPAQASIDQMVGTFANTYK